MELQEAIEVINERLSFHDHKQGHPMPSDCAAENEDLLCCIDKTTWTLADPDSVQEVPNPFRVALAVVLTEVTAGKETDVITIKADPEAVTDIFAGKTAEENRPSMEMRLFCMSDSDMSGIDPDWLMSDLLGKPMGFGKNYEGPEMVITQSWLENNWVHVMCEEKE